MASESDDDAVVECVVELHQLQFLQMRSRLIYNKHDSVNRKWQARLKNSPEHQHFTADEKEAILRV